MNDNVPDAEEVLKDLMPLVPALYGALEAGTLSAREFFEAKAAPIDPYHGSSHVRWEAKRYLDSLGQDITDCQYDREDLSNNGLCLTLKNKYRIRIRKSSDGLLPVPGPSKTMQAFYHQLAFPQFVPATEASATALLNLVLLWDTTDDYTLTELVLACPKAGGTEKASVEAHWYVPVPHPAFGLETPPSGPDDDLDLELEDDDDQTPA